jgi:hypothetical protein
MKTYVIVKLQVDGLHNWPQAGQYFKEVDFLSHPHRHMFHVEAKKEVYHDDRDVEFIMFKRDVEAFLFDKFYDSERRSHDFGSMSCEMIAKEIMEEFECQSVTVWEDNENGATIEK